MTKIESNKIEINHSAEYIFNFLTDFNNFEKLMPPQVTEWTSTKEEGSFNVNGLATIGLKIIEKTPFTKITLTSHGKVPFEFKLYVLLTEKDANNCLGQLLFEAELNMMMKMMAVKPLTNFFNMLAEKMKDIK